MNMNGKLFKLRKVLAVLMAFMMLMTGYAGSFSSLIVYAEETEEVEIAEAREEEPVEAEESEPEQTIVIEQEPDQSQPEEEISEEESSEEEPSEEEPSEEEPTEEEPSEGEPSEEEPTEEEEPSEDEPIEEEPSEEKPSEEEPTGEESQTEETEAEETESSETEEAAEDEGESVLVLADLAASASEIQAKETVVWNFRCENAEVISYAIQNADGELIASGSVDETCTISFTPDAAGEYTLTVTALCGEEQQSLSDTVLVTEEAVRELTVALTAGSRYAFVGDIDIEYTASVAGGVAPYGVAFYVNEPESYEDMKELAEAGDVAFAYSPSAGGEYAIAVVVTDAEGAQAEAEARMPVSVDERETEQEWEEIFEDIELTGDWCKDILTIAQTQLGYEESEINFIINEDGERKGYTRYGDFYGRLYDDWSSMFIAFCLEYAEIPSEDVPRRAVPDSLLSAVMDLDVFTERDKADPQPGDFIFFDDEYEDEYEEASRVGIVTSADGGISTIEGDSENGVRRCSYDADDERILGYASLAKMMELAGHTVEAEEEEPASEFPYDAAIIVLDVELFAAPDENAIILTELSLGQIVTVLSETDDGAWAYVTADNFTGYVEAQYVGEAGVFCECYDENGVCICDDDCDCYCHAISLLTARGITDTCILPASGEEWTVTANDITVTRDPKYVAEGAKTTLTAEYTGTSSVIGWQWQKSSDGKDDTWANIDGETGTSYTLTTGNDATNAYYRAIATVKGGATINSGAMPIDASRIVMTASASYVKQGDKVTYTAETNTTDAVQKHKWEIRSNDQQDFVDQANDSATFEYTFENSDPCQVRYTVQFGMGDNKKEFSSDVIVLVPVTITIAQEPSASEIGTETTLTASTTVEDNLVGYTWQQSTDGGTTWTDVQDGTATELSIVITDDNKAYQYKAIAKYKVDETELTYESAAFSPTVIVIDTETEITINASPTPYIAGSKLTLTPSATDSTDSSWIWQLKNAKDGSWTNVGKEYTYTIKSVGDNEEVYRVYRDIKSGSLITRVFSQEKSILPLTIETAVVPTNYGAESKVTFTVEKYSGGETTLEGGTWMWYNSKNGQEWTALSSTALTDYTFEYQLNATNVGYYYKAIYTFTDSTNQSVDYETDKFKLNPRNAYITASPDPVTVGESATLNATTDAVDTGMGYDFEWKWQYHTESDETWIDIAESSNAYTLTVDDAVMSNSYRVAVLDHDGTGTAYIVAWSDPFQFKNLTLTAAREYPDQNAVVGEKVNIIATVNTDRDMLAWKWQRKDRTDSSAEWTDITDSDDISGATTKTLCVTVKKKEVYTDIADYSYVKYDYRALAQVTETKWIESDSVNIQIESVSEEAIHTNVTLDRYTEDYANADAKYYGVKAVLGMPNGTDISGTGDLLDSAGNPVCWEGETTAYSTPFTMAYNCISGVEDSCPYSFKIIANNSEDEAEVKTGKSFTLTLRYTNNPIGYNFEDELEDKTSFTPFTDLQNIIAIVNIPKGIGIINDYTHYPETGMPAGVTVADNADGSKTLTVNLSEYLEKEGTMESGQLNLNVSMSIENNGYVADGTKFHFTGHITEDSYFEFSDYIKRSDTFGLWAPDVYACVLNDGSRIINTKFYVNEKMTDVYAQLDVLAVASDQWEINSAVNTKAEGTDLDGDEKPDLVTFAFEAVVGMLEKASDKNEDYQNYKDNIITTPETYATEYGRLFFTASDSRYADFSDTTGSSVETTRGGAVTSAHGNIDYSFNITLPTFYKVYNSTKSKNYTANEDGTKATEALSTRYPNRITIETDGGGVKTEPAVDKRTLLTMDFTVDSTSGELASVTVTHADGTQSTYTGSDAFSKASKQAVSYINWYSPYGTDESYKSPMYTKYIISYTYDSKNFRMYMDDPATDIQVESDISISYKQYGDDIEHTSSETAHARYSYKEVNGFYLTVDQLFNEIKSDGSVKCGIPYTYANVYAMTNNSDMADTKLWLTFYTDAACTKIAKYYDSDGVSHDLIIEIDPTKSNSTKSPIIPYEFSEASGAAGDITYYIVQTIGKTSATSSYYDYPSGMSSMYNNYGVYMYSSAKDGNGYALSYYSVKNQGEKRTSDVAYNYVYEASAKHKEYMDAHPGFDDYAELEMEITLEPYDELFIFKRADYTNAAGEEKVYYPVNSSYTLYDGTTALRTFKTTCNTSSGIIGGANTSFYDGSSYWNYTLKRNKTYTLKENQVTNVAIYEDGGSTAVLGGGTRLPAAEVTYTVEYNETYHRFVITAVNGTGRGDTQTATYDTSSVDKAGETVKPLHLGMLPYDDDARLAGTYLGVLNLYSVLWDTSTYRENGKYDAMTGTLANYNGNYNATYYDYSYYFRNQYTNIKSQQSTGLKATIYTKTTTTEQDPDDPEKTITTDTYTAISDFGANVIGTGGTISNAYYYQLPVTTGDYYLEVDDYNDTYFLAGSNDTNNYDSTACQKVTVTIDGVEKVLIGPFHTDDTVTSCGDGTSTSSNYATSSMTSFKNQIHYFPESSYRFAFLKLDQNDDEVYKAKFTLEKGTYDTTTETFTADSTIFSEIDVTTSGGTVLGYNEYRPTRYTYSTSSIYKTFAYNDALTQKTFPTESIYKSGTLTAMGIARTKGMSQTDLSSGTYRLRETEVDKYNYYYFPEDTTFVVDIDFSGTSFDDTDSVNALRQKLIDRVYILDGTEDSTDDDDRVLNIHKTLKSLNIYSVLWDTSTYRESGSLKMTTGTLTNYNGNGNKSLSSYSKSTSDSSYLYYNTNKVTISGGLTGTLYRVAVDKDGNKRTYTDEEGAEHYYLETVDDINSTYVTSDGYLSGNYYYTMTVPQGEYYLKLDDSNSAYDNYFITATNDQNNYDATPAIEDDTNPLKLKTVDAEGTATYSDITGLYGPFSTVDSLIYNTDSGYYYTASPAKSTYVYKNQIHFFPNDSYRFAMLKLDNKNSIVTSAKFEMDYWGTDGSAKVNSFFSEVSATATGQTMTGYNETNITSTSYTYSQSGISGWKYPTDPIYNTASYLTANGVMRTKPLARTDIPDGVYKLKETYVDESVYYYDGDDCTWTVNLAFNEDDCKFDKSYTVNQLRQQLINRVFMYDGSPKKDNDDRVLNQQKQYLNVFIARWDTYTQRKTTSGLDEDGTYMFTSLGINTSTNSSGSIGLSPESSIQWEVYRQTNTEETTADPSVPIELELAEDVGSNGILKGTSVFHVRAVEGVYYLKPVQSDLVNSYTITATNSVKTTGYDYGTDVARYVKTIPAATEGDTATEEIYYGPFNTETTDQYSAYSSAASSSYYNYNPLSSWSHNNASRAYFTNVVHLFKNDSYKIALLCLDSYLQSVNNAYFTLTNPLKENILNGAEGTDYSGRTDKSVNGQRYQFVASYYNENQANGIFRNAGFSADKMPSGDYKLTLNEVSAGYNMPDTTEWTFNIAWENTAFDPTAGVNSLSAALKNRVYQIDGDTTDDTTEAIMVPNTFFMVMNASAIIGANSNWSSNNYSNWSDSMTIGYTYNSSNRYRRYASEQSGYSYTNSTNVTNYHYFYYSSYYSSYRDDYTSDLSYGSIGVFDSGDPIRFVVLKKDAETEKYVKFEYKIHTGDYAYTVADPSSSMSTVIYGSTV